MADIKKYLDSIKTAIFGKDVRKSIHDGIEAINNDCTNRLNKQDSELSQSIKKQNEIIQANKLKQDELERKYDEQIKNIASSEPQNAEIVDARCGFETLGSIIKKKIYHFDNVEEMKNCLTLVPGDVVETLGYYEINDGGGATYKIRSKKSEDIEDNGSIHFIGANLVAELISKVIYPEMFGAYGDNANDDITAINNTISYCNKKRLDVNFNKKTYKITNSINLYQGIKINGNYATINGNFNGSLLKNISAMSSIRIHNLNLIGANNDEFTSNFGIELTCYYSTIEKVSISNCYKAIQLNTNASRTLVENKLIDITLRNNYNGLDLGNKDNNKLTDGFLKNIIIAGKTNEGNAINIGSCAGWIIDCVHIYGNCKNGLILNNGYHTNINNIYIEKAIYNLILLGQIQIDVNISNISGNLSIENCNGLNIGKSAYLPFKNSICNISNVLFTATAENCVGIHSENPPKTVISNYNTLVNSSISNFTKIDISKYDSNENVQLKNKLTDKEDLLKYDDLRISTNFKQAVGGNSEKNILIKLPYKPESYSFLKVNIEIITCKNYDSTNYINYTASVILICKNGNISISKTETGKDTGFSVAPTYTYNSETNSLNMNFTPTNADGYGVIFANMI